MNKHVKIFAAAFTAAALGVFGWNKFSDKPGEAPKTNTVPFEVECYDATGEKTVTGQSKEGLTGSTVVTVTGVGGSVYQSGGGCTAFKPTGKPSTP